MSNERTARLIFLCASFAFAASAQTTVVVPKESDEVLVNPGMGITTFQRFNGDILNVPGTWNEDGTAKIDKPPATKPDFPDSSIAYFRWYWSSIETEPGVYRWDIIDTAIAKAREHHQKLAFRVMPFDHEHPVPEWYRATGALQANAAAPDASTYWEPDYADPQYLKWWGGLIADAGARYDGNPYLDSVDISNIGQWGEGNSQTMPSLDVQIQLVDLYLQAFPRTPLLMNFDKWEGLSYAISKGTGWRLDCLGDMRPGWNHMTKLYPQEMQRGDLSAVWERRPVSMETCWVPSHWFENKWDVNYILRQALEWHISSLNVKSSAIPPPWKHAFEEFEKKMGYRFVLRRFEYDNPVKAGSMAGFHTWWVNRGVAPLYRGYILAFKLQSSSASAVIRADADVQKWLPGEASYESTLYVPEALSPGKYRVKAGLLDPRTLEPAIRLAIEGRDSEGWYDLGEITIQ